MYDAIIVGARCAGSSTALLLARKGYRVLLVDRARFPSDVPHGHMIHKDGPQRLRNWGLLDRVIEAGTPPLQTVSSYFGDFFLVAHDVVSDGIAWGYGPRRRVVDQILLDAAVEAGAEFREGFSVDELTFDEGRVTGIRGRSNGTVTSERATTTVGADGRNSRVARAVEAATYEAVPTLLCYYFSYWSSVPSEGMETYRAGKRVSFAHPTNDGLFTVFMGWPVELFHEVRADVERHFLEAADGLHELGERLRAGRREERFYGSADLPNFFRKPYGEGWALVGDAGCHKDPYTALGMADALRDAELLAGALDEGLSGEQPLMETLAGYEQRRNEAAMPDYRENLALAYLEPVPPRRWRCVPRCAITPRRPGAFG